MDLTEGNLPDRLDNNPADTEAGHTTGFRFYQLRHQPAGIWVALKARLITTKLELIFSFSHFYYNKAGRLCNFVPNLQIILFPICC